MVFDREIMSKIVDVIVLEDYLKWDGVAEGQALMWTQLFDIEISKTPVDKKLTGSISPLLIHLLSIPIDFILA
jgi:hypothetical protein